TVWSRLRAPAPDVLRAARGPLPRGYEDYLQLPDEITARTYELAAKITAGYPTQYDKALAIERWLDQNLTYTLELKEPGGREPIDFFLFDRKQGHCEYFASAFAILARAAHIPTRQVNGFLGGEWNEYQSYVAVRAGDAHSWDEVYFPGAGWVTFDPTPPDRHDPLGRGGDGIAARMSRLVDTLRFQWTKWVIEYDLVSQLSLFKDLGGVLRGAAGGMRDAIVDHWGTAAIAAAAIAAAVALRRRRRATAMAPTRATARPRARSPIGRLYDQTVRRIAKTGMAIEAAATPREVAERAAGKISAAAPELRELVELYYAAEWGRRSDAEAERRAEELAAAIRRVIEALPR
ncbi:MAG TPA: transglutaminase domain-containing protein, partial [Kofleriaceae bacterium]|nr:transglutaminase domain-containing protein [Kofleriaceae bacterium]